MPSINKILDKINQASQAVKSAKGIKAQISSAGYKGGVNTEEVDKLQEQAEESRRKLEKRRTDLQSQLSSQNQTKKKARTPKSDFVDLEFPIGGDHDNYLVFETRARRPRTGGNLLSSEADKQLSIVLPIPEGGIDAEASVQFTANEGVGAIARAVAGGSTAGQDAGGMIDEVINSAEAFFKNAIGSMGGGAQNIIAGQAKNPMKEMVLGDDVLDFRTHSFSWDLYPRNFLEARRIVEICNGFRIAALPDTFAAKDDPDASENFFNFPNIFEVTVEGPIAGTIERFLPMICTGVKVGQIGSDNYYIGAGNEQYFSGHTTLAVDFTEIKLMSQEVYADRVAPTLINQGDYGVVSDPGGSASLQEAEKTGTGWADAGRGHTTTNPPDDGDG